MNNIIYGLEIVDINKPLYKSITLDNIISFWYLYKTQTTFTTWLNKYMTKIDNLILDRDIVMNIDKFYDKNLDELINNLTYFVKKINDEEINEEDIIEPSKIYNNLKDNSVLTGGINIKQEIVKLLVSIPIFVFIKNIENINNNDLKKRLNDYITHFTDITSQKSNPNNPKIIADITRQSSNYNNLKFIVSNGKNDYLIQIVPDTYNNNNEIKIYEELSKDKNINNKILRICGNGFINKKDIKNIYIEENKNNNYKLIINLSANLTKNIKNNFNINMYDKIVNYIKQNNTNMIYSIFKYEHDYIPLRWELEKNDNLKKDCKFIENVMNIIYYMNKKLGFCHFNIYDPEEINILIDSRTKNILFYNFNLSSTNLNTNYNVFKNKLLFNPELYVKYLKNNFNRFGLIWDFFMFLYLFDSFKNDCNNYSTKINNIIKMFKKYYWEDITNVVKVNKPYDIIYKIIKDNADNDFNIFNYNNIMLQDDSNKYYHKYLKYKSKYLSSK